MTHVTCRLTAKNRDQLRNPTLGNRVRATFTFSTTRKVSAVADEPSRRATSFSRQWCMDDQCDKFAVELLQTGGPVYHAMSVTPSRNFSQSSNHLSQSVLLKWPVIGPLCLGYVSQLVDTVVGYFCITFLYFPYSFFCNLQCTLFVTNPADWLPYQ